MNRIIKLFFATTLCLFTILSVNVLADKPKKVTVGYLNLVNAQLVTKSLGLVQKEMPGVEIKYIKVGGGGDMLRAIAAKQIDFGGIRQSSNSYWCYSWTANPRHHGLKTC